MQTVFSGLRVVDCATYIAGPAAATILSDFGADVIKIERPPLGDPYRYTAQLSKATGTDLNYNWILDSRNKKSVALDLRDAEARAALLRLIQTADVFITNFQPQLLRKFHLEYRDLQPLNPRLVYASVSGYGEVGEDAGSPGYDITAYWARSGLMDSIHNADAEPALPPTGLGDHPTAITLFASILLALYQRQITGLGARARTSLVANGIWSNSCIIQAILCGAQFPPRRNTRRTPLSPLVNHYLAADGKRFLLCLMEPATDWAKLCSLLGWQDLLDDERFRDSAGRGTNSAALVELLDQAFAAHDLSYWKSAFREHDLVWAPVPSVYDVAEDQELDASGVFAELYPGLKTVRNPLEVEGIARRAPGKAPGVGEHTWAVLRDAGLEESQIARMVAKGSAYAGDPDQTES